MKTAHPFLILAGSLTFVVATGCGQQDAAEDPAATVAAADLAPAVLPSTPSPDGAAVFFITPNDGDTVPNPIQIEFGIDGMSVVAAGVDKAQSGHHHLLVDTDLPDLALPIPKDSKHIHFGDASTSTELTLAPGQHTLRLLLGDHLHIPHDPPVVSDPITIVVE